MRRTRGRGRLDVCVLGQLLLLLWAHHVMSQSEALDPCGDVTHSGSVGSALVALDRGRNQYGLPCRLFLARVMQWMDRKAWRHFY